MQKDIYTIEFPPDWVAEFVPVATITNTATREVRIAKGGKVARILETLKAQPTNDTLAQIFQDCVAP